MRRIANIIVLLFLLCPYSDVYGITVKMGKSEDHLTYGPISVLYCSNSERTVHFSGRNEYRPVVLRLLSPEGNGKVLISASDSNVIQLPKQLQLPKGKEKSLAFKLLSTRKCATVTFIDAYTQEVLLVVKLRGKMPGIRQRTSASYTNTEKRARIHHSIFYKSWNVSAGITNKPDGSIETNYSFSCEW